jgi:predicted nucleic acid-binding protein
MTRYLLDIDTLIDFSKGREPVVSLIKQWIANGDTVGICPTNITEFYSGLPKPERKTWNDFFESLTCWDITRNAARIAGEVRYELKIEGKIITTTDALISAVATEQKALIVTSNVDDYPLDKHQVLSPREK